MTCVVGLVHNNKVYLGADGSAVDDKSGYIIARKDPKVFTVGQYGIAFVDSFRMGQILQYNWIPPKWTPSNDLDKFMRTKFVDTVKDTFKFHGFGESAAGSEETGGVFLVAVKGTGRLFYIDEDYHVGEHILPYLAEGAGMDFAMGSLYTSSSLSPKKRVQMALEAAATFSTAVCKPFTIIDV